MSKLEDIQIHVNPPASPSQLLAILSELQTKLKALIDQGDTDSIDLRTLPMFPGDYEQLKETLGYGEINVSIDAMGPTEIYETAVPGIWWITHYNSNDENIAEYIEITALPEMLKTDPQEIEQGRSKLQQLIDNTSHNLNS